MHDLLDLRRVDPTYQLVFDDGSGLALTSDMAGMRGAGAHGPGSARGLQRYLDEGARHYRFVLDRMVSRDVRLAANLSSLYTGALALRVKPFVKHYRHMSAFFSAPRLKSAFTFKICTSGSAPSMARATFSLLAYSEMAHGVWYPQGGMYSIVEALVALAEEAGVGFEFRSPVSAIMTRGRRAWGKTWRRMGTLGGCHRRQRRPAVRLRAPPAT